MGLLPGVSLNLLGDFGDALGQWGEAQQDRVPLIGLGLLEHGVCAMQMVQYPEHPVALVEPVAQRSQWWVSRPPPYRYPCPLLGWRCLT